MVLGPERGSTQVTSCGPAGTLYALIGLVPIDLPSSLTSAGGVQSTSSVADESLSGGAASVGLSGTAGSLGAAAPPQAERQNTSTASALPRTLRFPSSIGRWYSNPRGFSRW